MTHPSYFALDCYGAGDPNAEVAAHVATCLACRAHLEASFGSVPIRKKRRVPPYLTIGLASLAAAAAIAMIAMPRATEEFTTVRGAPSVGVYVRRDATVSLFEANDTLRPGDDLRLSVVPEGFRYVTVLSGNDVLVRSEAVDPGRETVLPHAWEVDSRPGEERLVVVLTDAPVPEGSDPTRARGAFVRELRLRKETP